MNIALYGETKEMIDVLLKLGSLDFIRTELEGKENPLFLLRGTKSSMQAVRQFLTRCAIPLLHMTLGKSEENWSIGLFTAGAESVAHDAARGGQVGVFEWFFNRFPASLILQAPVRTYDASFPSRSAI